MAMQLNNVSIVLTLCFEGHFLCGNNLCEKEEDLKSWEVNFAHVEQGEKRNTRVKLSKSSVVYMLVI